MFIAYTVVAVVLALMSVGTATAKIRGLEPATSGLIAAVCRGPGSCRWPCSTWPAPVAC